MCTSYYLEPWKLNYLCVYLCVWNGMSWSWVVAMWTWVCMLELTVVGCSTWSVCVCPVSGPIFSALHQCTHYDWHEQHWRWQWLACTLYSSVILRTSPLLAQVPLKCREHSLGSEAERQTWQALCIPCLLHHCILFTLYAFSILNKCSYKIYYYYIDIHTYNIYIILYIYIFNYIYMI